MGRFTRLIMVFLVFSILVSACGRKGDLEAPPDDDQERRQILTQ